MTRLDPKDLVQAAGGYIKRHPEELLRMARNAVSLKFGVPLAVFRYFASQLRGAKAPRDITIDARPPGIFVAASFDLMKTPVRAAGTLYVDRLDLSADQLLVDLRLQDVSLKVLDEHADTPIAALLRSGALDLSRPGDLAAYLPKRPAFLVAAKGNQVTLDLMRHPQLSKERARKLVGLLLPFVSIEAVGTDGEHLDVAFRAFPAGAGEAVGQLRRALGL
jgi:hypothetical protein